MTKENLVGQDLNDQPTRRSQPYATYSKNAHPNFVYNLIKVIYFTLLDFSIQGCGGNSIR